jgi:hypothetical protein
MCGVSQEYYALMRGEQPQAIFSFMRVLQVLFLGNRYVSNLVAAQGFFFQL